MSTAISLDQEAHAVSQLIELLEQEQSQLIHANIGQIQILLKEKHALLQTLGTATHQRYQLLAASGYSANETGMSDWLAQHAPKSMQSTWTAMQQTLLKAKELNRLNGILINKHFARNQQRLAALQQQSETGHLYGPNGQTTSSLQHPHGLILG